jgi:hypothetical protein
MPEEVSELLTRLNDAISDARENSADMSARKYHEDTVSGICNEIVAEMA